MKHINLNYENSMVVNTTPVHVSNPKIIRRHVGVVVSEPETKDTGSANGEL